MSTSGTVSTTVFNTRKVIDHAFRRCRLPPQQITPEYIETALDLLYLDLSTLASRGIALWAVEKVIVPIYENVFSVPCPVGTVDVLNAFLRTATRLEGTYESSEGQASSAFDADLETACTQTTAAGWIQLDLESGTPAQVFGIYPNASGTWNITIQGGFDGAAWVDLYTNATLTVVAGEWFWVDIEGVLDYDFYRLKANGLTTILDVAEFVVANMPQEIPIAKLNRDDYANLPNKFFSGRPVQFWYDKQRDTPILRLWPAPEEQFTYSQITLFIQRYVQDVGTMVQEVEVPQRWYLSIITELAKNLALEIPEVKPGIYEGLVPESMNLRREAWDSETDSSPSRILPNISPYTR